MLNDYVGELKKMRGKHASLANNVPLAIKLLKPAPLASY